VKRSNYSILSDARKRRSTVISAVSDSYIKKCMSHLV